MKRHSFSFFSLFHHQRFLYINIFPFCVKQDLEAWENGKETVSRCLIVGVPGNRYMYISQSLSLPVHERRRGDTSRIRMHDRRKDRRRETRGSDGRACLAFWWSEASDCGVYEENRNMRKPPPGRRRVYVVCCHKANTKNSSVNSSN